MTVSTEEMYARLQRVIDYMAPHEVKHFEECYGVDYMGHDHEFTPEQQEHIFYDLNQLQIFLRQP